MGILMDRMPNVAVSSTSRGGGMSKSTQYQTLLSCQKTIKTIKCCAILYIIYIVKTLWDGEGKSPGATQIVERKKKEKFFPYKKNSITNLI